VIRDNPLVSPNIESGESKRKSNYTSGLGTLPIAIAFVFEFSFSPVLAFLCDLALEHIRGIGFFAHEIQSFLNG